MGLHFPRITAAAEIEEGDAEFPEALGEFAARHFLKVAASLDTGGGKALGGFGADAPELSGGEGGHEFFNSIGMDFELAIWLAPVTRDLGEQFIFSDASGCSELSLLVDSVANLPRNRCGRRTKVGNIEVGFIERKRLDHLGKLGENLTNLPRIAFVDVEACRHHDEFWAFAQRLKGGHCRVAAEFACLVITGRKHAPPGTPANCDGLSGKGRIVPNFDCRIEAVHIDVDDLAIHKGDAKVARSRRMPSHPMRPVLLATAAFALTLTSAFAQETPANADSASQESFSGPVVTIETSLGTITLELDDEKAPKTSKNFLHYVKTGFYEGTVFHRVIPEFMVQSGGYAQEPEGKLVEKTTRPPVTSEAKNGLSNLKGTLAMARKENSPNSATSQFFINTVDNTRLDPPSIDGVGYTVFGKVIGGMEIVEKINALPTTIRKVQTRLGNGSIFEVDLPNVPTEDVVIKKAVYVNDPAKVVTEPTPEPEEPPLSEEVKEPADQ